MRLSLFLIFIFLLPATGTGQGLFTTTIYDDIELDADYIELKSRMDRLNKKVDRLFEVGPVSDENKYLLNAIRSEITFGHDSLLSEKLQDSKWNHILSKYKIDKQLLLQFAAEVKGIKKIESQIYRIYTLRDYDINSYLFNSSPTKELIKEIKYYGVKDSERILEIGAGGIDFARVLGSQNSDCKIFLNEIDYYILKGIFNELKQDTKIKENFDLRSNEYFTVEGTETSTGIEDEIFDKIIIRNSFHHFSKPEEMLRSIKRSMNDQTEVILRERFVVKGSDPSCNDLMTKKQFEELFQKNGLERISARKLHKISSGEIYWLYKFELKSANNE